MAGQVKRPDPLGPALNGWFTVLALLQEDEDQRGDDEKDRKDGAKAVQNVVHALFLAEDLLRAAGDGA